MQNPSHATRGYILNSVLVLFLPAGLAFATYFLGTPIAQMDRAGREHLNIFMVVLGVAGAAAAILFRRRRPQGSNDAVIGWLALLIPAYAAFQLLPLPLSWLRVLSPARAELLDALAPLSLRPNLAPLSVAASLTLEHFLLFATCAIVFFTIRDIARSGDGAPWLAAFPIVLIAALQACWGISQFLSGATGNEALAHGSFAIRNH